MYVGLSRTGRRATVAIGVLLGMTLVVATHAPGAAAQGTPRPKIGRTVVVAPVAGKVRVKEKGTHRYQRLDAARAIKLGSSVDASHGGVKLSAAAGSRTESGVFSKGAFVVTQTRTRPRYVELRLVGGRPQACTQTGRTRAQAALSPSVIRRLRASARGHFRTRGRNSSATVRGTRWVTEDRCDGTVVTSQKGRVETTTLGAQDFQLDPGQSLVGYCADVHSTTKLTCVVELSIPDKFTYLFAIATVRTATQYQLCTVSPSAFFDCGTFPLEDTDGDGIRASGVGCVYSGSQDGVGEYKAQWNVDGNLFGPLFFTAPLIGPNTTEGCIFVNDTLPPARALAALSD